MYGSILEMGSDQIEWIIVYDSDQIDERIKIYESYVPIILTKEKGGFAYGSNQRNKGLELARGDWLYFLDDDNLIHHKLLEKAETYKEDDKILIFNQFTINRERKIKKDDYTDNSIYFDKGGYHFIDTAQLVVPSKYKHVKWENIRKLPEEYDYIQALRKEVGDHKFKFIDRIFTYRNYLRRYQV